ncbi:hypothetical protein BJI69_00450 [Luteibacter rhizovicinus DSM 16549]|uniref:DUF748 domain-containing protein n=1 Tax=Luteibacter rhizovicinus DSM 16549 TaxID=1440763 RepID=A0A0G9HCV8_9GAMM|nr:DUF748 domain-containing protein [Luteibacter rhizovicinus]APG02521.1 hypothetical protein BJI69_00450 [Luteibacter rhizovicinus DSM 16549]KLD67321.1 hypothetical protein Y883_08735 [Luteibacter rhizovicinus DSM 16549]KLD77073.1 hypothetical protein Y886_17720 [Xanthomonas hyacinthi DSM 19077]
MDTRKAWRNIRWDKGRDQALAVYRSRRGRRIGLGFLIAIVVFGLLGFLAAPSIIRSQIASRASTALGRPVTVGDVSLNPFTLKLVVEHLHIGEPDGHAAFVDVDRLTANASWASLFRAAPILDELRIDSPRVRIRRTAPQRFNFTDILERLASKPAAPDTGPARFAVSNIALHGGQIDFDDRVLDATHRVDHLELGIPFIASLPSDTDIFVQPLLAMNVDGSPLKAQGQTKPFASSRESSITFRFDRLDLARYVGFAPTPLPVAVPSGKLTGVLALHFVMAEAHPSIRLNGRLALDDLKVTGKDGSALLDLGHGDAELTVLEPLTSRYRLGAVTLERASVRYAVLPGGKSNFDALTATGPTANAPPADAKAAPLDVRIDSLTLKDSHIAYADLAASSPAHLDLEHLQGTLRGLSTVKARAATLDVSARMAGGSVSTQGSVDLPAGHYTGKLALKEVSLPALMPLVPPLLNADITGGKIDAEGTLALGWSESTTLRLTNTKARLDGFTLVPRGGRASPVTWTSLSAGIALIDLASREARVDEVLLGGLGLDLQRLANGNVDLASVMPPSASAAHPAGSDWHWSVAHLGLNDGKLTLRDAKAPGKRNTVTMNATAFGIDGLSDNLHQPLKLDLKGSLGDGAFAVTGTVRPDPLDADLTIQTTRIDVAPLQNLVTVPLNVRVGSGLLSLDGQVRYAAQKDTARIGYRGRATLGRVRVLDKVTNDDFLRWTSLSASNMVVDLGQGVPRVAIGGLALDDFYARVIINATGRLNLQDVIASPEAPGAVSVTQAQANPAPAVAPAAVPAASGPDADIRIGQITLSRGQLNYTDNFIKPNYTADVTQLTGKIGAFGTAGNAPPAELTLQGQLDSNAPVDIEGTINPLAPVAFLDITAKAEGIQLTNLSPYSGKYAGYPISSGRLNVDVHYTLDQRKLSADNHIFIDQLTFGDRIEGPGISHLPVKLAVALLRDSQGRIDVHVPVSGSLDDPHFSVGGLVWRAIGNLIVKAVTSPFRLLASIGGGREDLGYVEFAPGSDVLDAAAQDKLGQIVKVLGDKPSVSLDIIGRIDPAKDESGLRKVMVEDLIHKEQVSAKGDDATAPTADEQDKYLERAYRHADFPKPKNVIGLTKSQPPEEMRTLMETNMPVDADALRHLAERRANAVRQWLQGKVDDKRLFVQAPKLDPKGIDDAGKTTRVDFGLH